MSEENVGIVRRLYETAGTHLDAGLEFLVLSEFHATGRNVIEVSIPFAHLWTARSGQVVRMEAFSDQKKGLEAVGLSE
jgi:hypothetical protein